MRNKFRYLTASAIAFVAGILPALAAPTSMENTLGTMKNTLKGWAQPVVDVVMIVLGLFAIARAVSTYVQTRRSQGGGGNEELLQMIATIIIVVGFVFLVNLIFFQS